jgi:hypothetical protein
MEEVVKDDAAAPTNDGPLASDVHVDTIINQQKKKKLPKILVEDNNV